MRASVNQLESKIKTLERKIREYEQVAVVFPSHVDLKKITFSPPDISDRIEQVHK
jgi:hypothetical protein